METLTDVMDAWETFFAAQLGAAATLGGLVFVGLSLNLTKILSFPVLPNRALLALVLLVQVLVVSSLMLMPGQSFFALGIETLILGAALWLVGTVIDVRSLRDMRLQKRRTFIGGIVMLQLASVPYIIGGILFLAGSANGLYWIGVAIIVSFIKAVADAWVLLVEINR